MNLTGQAIANYPTAVIAALFSMMNDVLM